MTIEVFYHIRVADPSSLYVIEEQLNVIQSSNLYDLVDKINCCLVGDNQFCFDHLFHKIPRYGEKFVVLKSRLHDKTFERFTLDCMKENIKERGSLYLYIHSKGVTEPTNQNIRDWRRCMEYFLINRAADCIEKLRKGYDTVGIMKHPRHEFQHYSGNFWWATGGYLKQLFKNHIMNDDSAEFFLFLNNPKAYDFFPIFDIDPSYNGFHHRLLESTYKDVQDKYVHVYGHGGLGNSIFQICCAIYYCEKYGYKLQLIDTFELNFGTVHNNKMCQKPTSYRYTILNHPKLQFIPADQYNYDKVVHNDFSTSHIVPCATDRLISIEGYCQNAGLFNDINDKIPSYFNLFDNNLYELLKKKYKIDPNQKNIMIGMRLGNDFRHMTKITSKSYEKALQKFVRQDEKEYNLIIISDDNDYHGMLDFKISGRIIFIDENDVNQMYAGLLCDYFILCESTFHYWIAYFKQLMDPSVKILYFKDTDMDKYNRVKDNWINVDY